jgi:uncharacterized protein YggU (UPF0235/DUF167 family)
VIDLAPHERGVVLPVKAMAGSKRDGLRGEQDGALKVSVVQVAEKGKANKSLVAVISRELGLRKSQVELLSGHTAASKRFLVTGVGVEELARRIRAALDA